KSIHDAPRGSLPPVVIREPDSRKFQSLPEVQGKGKEKVNDEHVSRLTDSDSESDEKVPLVVKVGAQDEGQAGPNPGVLTEGQAGSDPGDDAEPQPQSSRVVHTGPNLEHMELEATDRALTAIINLCLTGKTLGCKRPRAPVLQILWGIVNRAYIDYAERTWEEFTQSIHFFVEDKKNLALHTHKHKLHSRPDSPLHLPYEEYILGYLKFSAKGTKREVFRMPIPNALITADIQGEQDYKEYLEKVAKHQRYLDGKEGSDLESPTPKPAKATKKSKPSAPKADLRPPPTSSLRLVDESIDEGIPEKEPRFDDEEADIQREVKESLKSVHNAPRGPLPSVVIREPDSGKFQPLTEVQGKGKEKVNDEQVTHDLLTLQTPKKVSPAEQYIFQRRTPASTKPSCHAESPLIYVALGLTDSDSKSDKEVPLVVKAGAQDEGQAGPNPGVLTEGQAGSDPDVSTQLHSKQMDEGFTATAYPNVQENLKLTVEEQVILEEPTSSTWTLSSLQHLAKDFSFGDLFFNDKHSKAENEKTTAETKAESMVSLTIQQDTSAIPPITTPVIDLTSRPDSPNVHRPLQAKAIETTMTTTTTTHPPPPKQQQSTTDSMLIKRIDELEKIMANLIQDNKHLEGRLDSHGAHLAEARKKKKKRHDSPKTPPGSPPHQPPPPPLPAGPSGTSRSPRASGSSQVLPPPPLPLSTNQEGQSHGSTSPSSLKTAASAEYTSWITTDTRLKPSVSLILEYLYMDDDMAPDEHVHSSDDEDIGNAHIPKVNLQQDWWKPLEEDRSATPKPAWSIPSSDLPVLTNNWASALASTYTPPPENSLLAQTGDMAMFIDWFFKRQGITELKPQDLEGPVFELVKVFHPNVIHLQYQMEKFHKLLTDSVDESIIRHNVSKPLPLGGPPGQIDEALNYRVKEFKVNRMSPGLNTRFWTRKDVDRSKEFMFAIQKRLKTRGYSVIWKALLWKSKRGRLQTSTLN
nr:E-beta-farnesene synthase [Tanacetum cinerariifolium]